jgi:hypothetical protein
MTDPNRPTNRRSLMLGGAVVAVATLAGVGAWWQYSAGEEEEAAAAVKPSRKARAAQRRRGKEQKAVSRFWAMKFALPDGGELLAADFRGRALLVNFWATWCPPCVEEMPLLARFWPAFTPKTAPTAVNCLDWRWTTPNLCGAS